MTNGIESAGNVSTGSGAAKTTAPATSTGSDPAKAPAFADTLSTATGKQHAATPKAAPKPAGASLPDGATSVSAVKGHAYAKVHGGPHDGEYVNHAAGNPRTGQLFHLVVRDGREFHVYGSGKDRTVVSLPLAADHQPAAAKPAGHSRATGGASGPRA
jgi:hypothetical protein